MKLKLLALITLLLSFSINCMEVQKEKENEIDGSFIHTEERKSDNHMQTEEGQSYSKEEIKTQFFDLPLEVLEECFLECVRLDSLENTEELFKGLDILQAFEKAKNHVLKNAQSIQATCTTFAKFQESLTRELINNKTSLRKALIDYYNITEVSDSPLQRDDSFQVELDVELNGDIQDAAKLIVTGVSKNLLNQCLLEIGRTENWLEMIPLLLFFGADINSCDEYMETALHKAVLYNNLKATQALLKAGANPNIRNIRGRNCLFSINYGANEKEGIEIKILRLLLNAGADLNLPDNSGKTYLDYAKANGHTSISNFIEGYNKMLIMESKLGKKN